MDINKVKVNGEEAPDEALSQQLSMEEKIIITDLGFASSAVTRGSLKTAQIIQKCMLRSLASLLGLLSQYLSWLNSWPRK